MYSMYSTCLFCHAHLGANAVLERFPVGRRLAFDPARGRLWVVCRKGGRWNLAPAEGSRLHRQAPPALVRVEPR